MSPSAQTVPAPQRFLRPGEFAFGAENLSTVLGSCVAITVWHPRLCIGGMCHYLLPARASMGETHPLGTFADEAMALFIEAMGRHGTRPSEYQAKLFGGANMFPHIRIPASREVGLKNVEAGRQLLQVFGIPLQGEDVGGSAHRRVLFDPSTGEAWVKRVNEAMLPNWVALAQGAGGAT